MAAFDDEKILTVHHWTDRLFSFTTTRSQSLRFSNGHFTMIGLRVNGKPLLRAYSIVSPNYEETLEFLSIKVQDGPLTSRLQHIQPGDSIIVGHKPTGTLLIDYLVPGKRLYMFGTGTGLAPFMSIIRDPDTYEKFDEVILVHGCRLVSELDMQEISLRKRPVESERVEKMVSTIVRELESGGEAEVSSEAIGEIVMEHLRQLDDVAYVRFASVYRNFREEIGRASCRERV